MTLFAQTLDLLAHEREKAAPYLLIDNSAYDGDAAPSLLSSATTGFGTHLKKLQRSGLPHTAVIGDIRDPEQALALPILVCWQDSPEARRWLDALLRTSSGRCALSILHSPDDLDALQQRLALRTEINLQNADYVLRYYDNRILGELWPILTPAQQHAFLAVADAWYYLGRDDEWHLLPGAYQAHDNEQLPLKLTGEQEDALFLIGNADRMEKTIDDLLDDNPLHAQPRQARYEWVAQQLAQASRLSIHAQPAQLHFCLLALQEGNGFHQRPEWQTTLAALQKQVAAS